MSQSVQQGVHDLHPAPLQGVSASWPPPQPWRSPLPSSHSSGQHPAVQITGGCEQLRLKIGPNTSVKTPLLPELAV